MNLLRSLKSLLRLGKKNRKNSFKEELEAIKGVGPEFAERLVKVFGDKKNMAKKKEEIDLWVPSHVANRVIEYLHE